MNANDKQGAVATGTVAIGDMEFVLKLMADNFYGTYLAAIKEFVANAIEAMARNIWVVIYKGGRRPFILIEDDGAGMTQEFLTTEVPRKIGDSIKRGAQEVRQLKLEKFRMKMRDETTGHLGVGMITGAMKLMANKLHAVSTTESQKETYTLAIQLEGKVLPFEVVKETQRSIGDRGKGTKIYLYGLPTNVMNSVHKSAGMRRKEQTSSLGAYLGEAFRKELLDETVTIHIEQLGGRGRKKGQQVEHVKPVRFLGTRVQIEPVQTRLGPIQIELYYKAPRSKGTISLQHVITILCRDITKLPDLNDPVLNFFEGVITASWVKRSGGGPSIAHKSYKVFVHQLREHMLPLLAEYHRRIVEETVRPDEAFTLRDAFKQAFRGDIVISSLPQTLTADTNGVFMPAQRSDLGRKTGKIKEQHLGRTPYATPLQPPIIPKPIPESTITQIKTAKVSALTWDMAPFPIEKRHLYYELVEGRICINTTHKEYGRFVINPPPDVRPKSRKARKLYWMVFITCEVLIDLNFPPEDCPLIQRDMALQRLCSSVLEHLKM